MNESVSPSVGAVIVNYAAASFIMEHIDKLVRELSGHANAHVFIVDNQSPKNEAAELKEFVAARDLTSLVTIIDAGGNLGFAGGNNLGFRHARAGRADYVFFINPDAWPRPGALARLIEVMNAHPKAAVVGARLENADGSPRYCYFNFPTLFGEFANESGLNFLKRAPKPAPGGAPFEVDWVSGAAFLFRAKAAGDAPPMDDAYFLYFEETDMMRRLRREGWEVWHAPEARVVHAGGHSTGMAHGKPAVRRLPDYWFTSWRRYYSKNHGRAYAAGAALAKLSGVLTYHVQRTLRGRANEKPKRYMADVAAKCFFLTVKGE